MSAALVDENSMMVADSRMDSLARVGPMQQVRTQHATAISVQLPRMLPAVEKRFLEEAAVAGDTFFYGWGAGKDRIEGASIDLAMALVRTWGNCAVEMLPIQETYEAWIFSAAFVDLETGFTLTRQFRQSKKWTVHGKFDEARKDDIRFQIGQSKAIRNVVLNALPKWLANKAIDAAKANVRGSIEKAIGNKGAEDVKKRAMAKLAENGAPELQVLAKFGRATVAALTVEDLVIIHGDIQALHNGQDTVENVYPPVKLPDQPNGNGGNRSPSDKIADALEGKSSAKPTAPPETPPETASTAPADEQQSTDAQEASPYVIGDLEEQPAYVARIKKAIVSTLDPAVLEKIEIGASASESLVEKPHQEAIARALSKRREQIA